MPQYSERAEFIEETGLLFENMGMTRMAGRILGYLMVSDKEMVSFDEITKVLQASKSSISTNLKALIQIHFVKPVSKPGDRKTYYMLAPDIDWKEYYDQKLISIKYLKQLFEKALELRVSKEDETSLWLNNAIDFYGWLVKELPALMVRWKEEKKAREGNK